MVQYYCAGVSGISQAQEVYRQTMSGVDMVSDSFGSYDKIRILRVSVQAERFGYSNRVAYVLNRTVCCPE